MITHELSTLGFVHSADVIRSAEAGIELSRTPPCGRGVFAFLVDGRAFHIGSAPWEEGLQGHLEPLFRADTAQTCPASLKRLRLALRAEVNAGHEVQLWTNSSARDVRALEAMLIARHAPVMNKVHRPRFEQAHA